EEEAVLRADLRVDGRAHLGLFEIVVRALAGVGVIVGVERPTAVALDAVERAALNPLAAAEIFRGRHDAEVVALKEPRVRFLGDVLWEGARGGRREEIRDELLVEPRRL